MPPLRLCSSFADSLLALPSAGLPDFRGTEGFWRAYPPIARLGLRLDQMSTPHWFRSDPQFAWGFFGHRFHLYSEKTPHAGYDVLLELARQKMAAGGEYFVYTSNVDGHFEKAGFDPLRITECHGSLHYLQVRPAVLC